MHIFQDNLKDMITLSLEVRTIILICYKYPGMDRLKEIDDIIKCTQIHILHSMV